MSAAGLLLATLACGRQSKDLHPILIYSGDGTYSDPFTFFTLCFINQKSKFYFSLMFTQLPILTEKNRNVDIFANVLKKKNWNIRIFVINLQKCLHFLSRWGAEWTLMRNKINFFLILANGCNETKTVNILKGSEYFPYPRYTISHQTIIQN